ncbi:unnamed protein product [Adineta ricciae]|uniref:VWFA domain-containing protein n=1 Tax=Adineta ricciae TaxID=249248 RepID=A0A814MEY2_ADIRI|nr:unnamed protein product [Adineta ricciae]
MLLRFILISCIREYQDTLVPISTENVDELFPVSSCTQTETDESIMIDIFHVTQLNCWIASKTICGNVDNAETFVVVLDKVPEQLACGTADFGSIHSLITSGSDIETIKFRFESNSGSTSNARFIILITDPPGHGRELNDNPAIDKYPQGVETHTVQSICERLLKKDAEIDLMFCYIKPNATAKMQGAFAAYYNAKKEETGKAFTVIKLFDDKQQETQSFHFVFVLDESGSMGSQWQALQKVYQAFLTRRNDDQGGDDHFTIVKFNHITVLV